MYPSIDLNRQAEQYIDVVVGGFRIPLELLLGIAAFMTLAYVIKATRASLKANELKTVPTLTLKYTKSTGRLALFNLSDKIAYNITVRPLYFRNRFTGHVYKVFFSLPDKNYINAHEEITLNERKLKDGGIDEEQDFAKIVASVTHDPLYIEFIDIQGYKYYTLINFNAGPELIVKGPTKLNLFRRALIYLQYKKSVWRFNRFYRTKLNREYPEKTK